MKFNITFKDIDVEVDQDGNASDVCKTYGVILPDNVNKGGNATTCFFYSNDELLSSEIPLHGRKVSIKVSEFSFKHEVYKPLKINAELIIKSTDEMKIESEKDGDTTTFYDSSIPLDTLKAIVLDLYQGSYSLDLAEKRVYNSLMVTDVKFSVSRSASAIYIVKLELHSPDYAMTLNKASKCYTGKTLTQIAKDVQTSFSGVKMKVENMNYLMSGTDDAKTECVLPYVVQYQESSYDFLCRTARRYGEFMFYDCTSDNNTLSIGYDMSSDSIELNTDTYVNIDYHSYAIDIFSEQVNMQYHKNSESSNNGGAIFTSQTVTMTNTIEKFKDIYDADSDSKTINNYGINQGRAKGDKTTPDVMLSPSSSEDYNFKNDYVSGSSYSNLMNFCVKEALIPSIAMTGLNSPTITSGIMASGIKTALSFAGFETIALASNGLYKANKGDKESLDADKYFDDSKLVDSQLIAFVDTCSKYVTANMITINYGATSSADMALGHRFSIKGSDGNVCEKYIVTSIEFTFDGSVCSSKANAVPIIGDTDTSTGTIEKFYPPQVDFPLYREAKSQLAIVMDSIDPSGLNRVRVKYPWQEDANASKESNASKRIENSTPWIRLSLPMASSDGTGLNFMPAANDEVMINYQDGDIERPYVEGILFSANHAPVLNTSSNTYKYIKSTNGHTLTFYDNPDSSDFLVNMMPFSNILKTFYWPKTFDRINDNTKDDKLAGFTMISDKYGMYNMKLSTDERKISISSPYGTVAVDAFEGISLSAPNGNISIKGKNISLEAGNNISITSGTNVKNFIWDHKVAAMTDAKDNWISIISAPIVGALIDLSFMRTVFESFFRPLEGTLLIKSHRNVLVEAGSGDTSAKVNQRAYCIKMLECLEKFGDFMVAFRGNWGFKKTIKTDLKKNLNNKIQAYNTLRDSLLADVALDSEVYKTPSITKMNASEYIPEVKEIEDDSLLNYHIASDKIVKTDECSNKITAEIGSGYLRKNISNNRIKARNEYLTDVKKAMQMYSEFINEIQANERFKKIFTEYAAANDYNKCIYNFVHGKGVDSAVTDYKTVDITQIPALFKSLIRDKNISREAYCCLLIRFADYIKDVNALKEDGYISDIFELNNNNVDIYVRPFRGDYYLNSKEFSKTITITAKGTEITKIGNGNIVYANWKNIIYTLSNKTVDSKYLKDQMLKTFAATIKLGKDEIGNMYNHFSKESRDKLGAGDIKFASSSAATSKFNNKEGRFESELIKGQQSQLASALKIKI